MIIEVISIKDYDFRVIKKRYGYVIVNKTLNTHSHLPNYRGCVILLNLIKNDVDIKDKYLRKAKDRLIPNNNNRKDRYINKSRFQRKSLGKNVY